MSAHASRWSLALLMLAAIVVCWGCKTTPVSNRRQLNVIPESQLVSMGLTSYQQILSNEQLSSNQRYIEMINRVGQRIADVVSQEYPSAADYKWEFNVIKSDQMNAFALPGGKVAFYEGIIPVCQSEAGIAVVMSHEIAHALLNHGGERMSQELVAQGVGKLVQFGARNQTAERQDMIMKAYGVGSKYGVLLPYSRKQESEADLVGLKLMAKAGYDPSEAPQFWERFGQIKGSGGPSEFLSTHPSDQRRATALREQLPDALQIYRLEARVRYGIGDPVTPGAAQSNTALPASASN